MLVQDTAPADGYIMRHPMLDAGSSGPFKWTPAAIGKGAQPVPDALLTNYRMEFELPSQGQGVTAPWRLHLEANGNGFISVNGHCIGRYWQVGPQHDFFVPDCWLNVGPGETNNLNLELRPVDKGVALHAVSMNADPTFAVETPLPAQ
jgi:hypothetical protein